MPPIHLTRRQFTVAVGTSISAFALAPWVLASTRRCDTFFEWKQLRPGVHAVFGQGLRIRHRRAQRLPVDRRRGRQVGYREGDMVELADHGFSLPFLKSEPDARWSGVSCPDCRGKSA